MTTPFRRRLLLILLLPSVFVLLTGAARAGHETPRAVFDQFVKASDASRWSVVFGCYDERSGVRLLASIALNADAWVRTRSNDQAKAAEWAALVRTHALVLDRRALEEATDGTDDDDDNLTTEEQEARDQERARRRLARVVGSVANRAACFQAVMAFMARATGRANRPFDGTLETITETGDTATATLVQEVNGQQIRRQFHFVRVDDSWFIALP